MELALQLAPGSDHDAVAHFLAQGFPDGDPMAEGAYLVQELGREVALHLPGLTTVGQLR